MSLRKPQQVNLIDLKPNLTEAGLPDYSVQDLRNMAAAGFSRLGTVAALILPDSNFLMFHHKGEDKGNPKIQHGGAFGFIAETGHYARVNKNTIVVESSIATFQRGFLEEARMDPRFLNPHFSPAGSYATSRWPVGFNAEQREQYAFAVIPVMHLPSRSSVDNLIDNFVETTEIDGLEVMSRTEIRHRTDLRHGTLEILNVVESSGLYETESLGQKVEFPDYPIYDGKDIVFDKMSL